ncbi:hypothetical protein L208DRAFT_1185011, partial [Tricholoma matsutake]
LGYDIMCAFIKTIARSSLSAKMVAFHLQGVVPAFHGHAHNQACQVYWHPMYVEGVGLEDFKKCECTFYKSNELASVTHLATPFYCQQQIDEHFHFHNLDKHAASGNFIFQNYHQALEQIQANREHLNSLTSKLSTTSKDYEAYLTSEHECLWNLCVEPPEVVEMADYIDHLIKVESDKAKLKFQHLDYNILNNGYTHKQIANVKTRYRTTYSRLLAQHEEVCQYKEEHSIETRWTPSSPEYNNALVTMSQWAYRKALDLLECLFIQQLLELMKLGRNGVG